MPQRMGQNQRKSLSGSFDGEMEGRKVAKNKNMYTFEEVKYDNHLESLK